MNTLIAGLALLVATQSTPSQGRGHDAPKTTKSESFKIGPITGAGAAMPTGQISETADIGLKLPPAERRMTLIANNMSVQDALAKVAEVGEIKLSLTPDVKGTITLKLEDMHWNDVFHAILKNKKLGFEREDGVIVVETMKEMLEKAQNRPQALSGEAKGAPPVTVLLPVRFATAEELVPVVRSLLSNRGSVAVDKRSNTLIVTDPAADEIRARLVL